MKGERSLVVIPCDSPNPEISSAPSRVYYNTLLHPLHPTLSLRAGNYYEEMMQEKQVRSSIKPSTFSYSIKHIVFRHFSISFGYFPIFSPVFARGKGSTQSITLT